MSLPCNIKVAEYLCDSPRVIEGRACNSVTAIVLVPLGTTYESYTNMVSFPYVPETFSQIPVSVHFTVARDGRVAQYANVLDTVKGVRDYVNPSYPFRPIPTPPTVSEKNCPFVFVGVEVPLPNTGAVELCPTTYEMEQFQRLQLTKVVCCIAKQFGIVPSADTVIVGYDLDTRLTLLTDLPNGFIEDLIDASQNDCWDGLSTPLCIGNGGSGNVGGGDGNGDESPCVDCLDSTCCPEHGAKIAVLENTIEAQNAVITQLQTEVGGYSGTLISLNNQLADIVSHYQQILAKFDAVEDCFNCLCPQQSNSFGLDYEASGSENIQALLPLSPTLLRAPIQIADTSPATANSSSYFIAQLNQNCNHEITVNLALVYSEYFDGSKVWVDMVTCDGRVRIAETTVTGNGAVSLSGMAMFNPTMTPCSVWFEVYTNDNKTGSKFIDYARIRMSCI